MFTTATRRLLTRNVIHRQRTLTSLSHVLQMPVKTIDVSKASKARYLSIQFITSLANLALFANIGPNHGRQYN